MCVCVHNSIEVSYHFRDVTDLSFYDDKARALLLYGNEISVAKFYYKYCMRERASLEWSWNGPADHVKKDRFKELRERGGPRNSSDVQYWFGFCVHLKACRGDFFEL